MVITELTSRTSLKCLHQDESDLDFPRSAPCKRTGMRMFCGGVRYGILDEKPVDWQSDFL